jgi:hypothetical protein
LRSQRGDLRSQRCVLRHQPGNLHAVNGAIIVVIKCGCLLNLVPVEDAVAIAIVDWVGLTDIKNVILVGIKCSVI